MGIIPDHNGDRRRLVALGVAIIALAPWLVILPLDNFQVSDSWYYLERIRFLVERGEWHLPGMLGSPMLPQLILGAVFKLVVGDQIGLMSLFTLVAALGCMIFAYRTARLLGQRREIAFILTCGLGTCWLFQYLSLTFMTDIPFLCFELGAIYFFMCARQLGDTKNRYALLCGVMTLMAVTQRPEGIALPMAALLFGLTKKGRTLIPRSWRVASLVFLGLSLALLLVPELFRSPEVSFAREKNVGPGFWPAFEFTLDRLLDGIRDVPLKIGTIGILLIPILPILTISPWTNSRAGPSQTIIRWRLVSVFLATLVFAAIIARCLLASNWSGRYPLLPGYLRDFGLGPPSLADRELGSVVHLPVWISSAIMMMGALCAGFLTYRLLGRLADSSGEKQTLYQKAVFWLLLLVIAIQLGIFVVTGIGFDRYLLSAFFICLLLQMPSSMSRIRLWATVGLLSLNALIGIFLLQDHWAWQRARWRAVESIHSEFPNAGIIAGFEHDWQLSYRIQRDGLVVPDPRSRPWFVITMHPPQHNAPMKEIPYYSWNGFKWRAIYVQQVPFELIPKDWKIFYETVALRKE